MSDERKLMKPTTIIKNYFGLLPGQKLGELATEIRVLKQDDASYREVVTLAAVELGVEVEWA